MRNKANIITMMRYIVVPSSFRIIKNSRSISIIGFSLYIDQSNRINSCNSQVDNMQLITSCVREIVKPELKLKYCIIAACCNIRDNKALF